MWTSTSNRLGVEQEAVARLAAFAPGKMAKARLGVVWLAVLVLAASGQAQDWLDRIDDSLHLQSKGGLFRADLTGLFDLEGYYVDERPPGLLYGYQSFVNYRTTFFVDATLGNHFYAFLQARLDRGFDPGETDFQARLDEYLLRWTPLNGKELNLQAGKFATIVGNWVQRHDSWLNPLITAPLPYENLTTVSYEDVPASPAAFLARRNLPDNKDSWLPVIWGPVYATGADLFGSLGKFDYAVSIMNAAISSHPYTWDPGNTDWQFPTYSARVGYRPNAAWEHAVCFSIGPYLSLEAQHDLPLGKSISDYNQITFNYNVSYAWHRWQLWSEVFLTRFQVPNVGNADVLSYYVEAKYKITSALYGAARWNQQLFGTIADGFGGSQAWDNNMTGIDVALGCRFTRHFQGKIQYSFRHRNGSLQQGEQLVAAQLTMRF
jgi:hypothetical protein